MKTIVTKYQNNVLKLSGDGVFQITKRPIVDFNDHTSFTVVDQYGKSPIDFNLCYCVDGPCVQFRFADNMEAKPVKLQALRELPFTETLQVVTGSFNFPDGDVSIIPVTYSTVDDNDFIENRIINLTEHSRTEDQDGVFDITNDMFRTALKEALTFTEPPTKEEIGIRANILTNIAVAADASAAMIDGPPYLMGTLERRLIEAGIKPLYSFTRRETVEDADSGRRGYRHSGRCNGRTHGGYGSRRSGDHRDDSYGSRGYGHGYGFSADGGYGRHDRDIPERDRDGEVTKTSIDKHVGWVEVSR